MKTLRDLAPVAALLFAATGPVEAQWGGLGVPQAGSKVKATKGSPKPSGLFSTGKGGKGIAAPGATPTGGPGAGGGKSFNASGTLLWVPGFTISPGAEAAASMSGGFPTGGAVNATYGWEFTTSTPRVVTSLGYYDAGGNGIGVGRVVTLFNMKGTPIVAGSVVAGRSQPLVDGFRYVDVGPTPLPAGTYVIAAPYYPTDPQLAGASITTLSDVTLVRSRTSAPFFGSHQFPKQFGPAGGVFGPNLRFRALAVPPATGVSYCTAGLSASGCQATISGTGVASATAASGFTLSATNVEGARTGLFFFGTNGRKVSPWGNGTSYQCVVPPLTGAGLIPGVGTKGACDGSYIQDLNAMWTANPIKNPGAGAEVQAQLWYRDPVSTSDRTTSLSNALEFMVAP